MALTNLEHTMLRIDGATPGSRIAVFKCDKPGHLNTVFGDTVTTQKLIKSNDQAFVGIYHRQMDISAIESKLRNVISVAANRLVVK